MGNLIRQRTLFENVDNLGLKIDDAASQAGVSTATIRNWIKTGYLEKENNGFICLKSFKCFLANVAGTDKLNSRANKSHKDSHNHEYLTSGFLDKISVNQCDGNALGEKYECSLSDSYRNKEGIYYTPHSIVEDIFTSPFKYKDIGSKTFCDPCCGSGNFIVRALDLGFRPENIYGFDTDPVAVELTKSRLLKKTGFLSPNIIQKDFLGIFSGNKPVSFDCIYTNPPWGKKLPKKDKEFYGVLFKAGKSLDTCSLFFFACLNCLNDDGKMGLLLPEAFFNISTFRTAREKMLELSVERLVDYGKCFKGLITKAQAIVLINRKRKDNENDTICETNGRTFYRPQNSFGKNPKSIFNFHCDNSSFQVIEHLFSISHTTLKGYAKWGLGIVTGNNKRFCKDTLSQEYIPVYRGSDITKLGLREPKCFIPRDFSLYQQVAAKELFDADEKLIYRFISSNLCFYCDTEQRRILNSANMLILKKGFPISSMQLCSLLNSDIMNWLFKSIFNTHKILRGDLELLPIHCDYFKRYSHFDEDKFLSFLKIQKETDGAYRIKE